MYGDYVRSKGVSIFFFFVITIIIISFSSIAVGIDHINELVEMSRINIQTSNPDLLESGRVRLLVGDGRQGFAELGPYDAIHVGAAAPTLPQALVDQLKVTFFKYTYIQFCHKLSIFLTTILFSGFMCRFHLHASTGCISNIYYKVFP